MGKAKMMKFCKKCQVETERNKDGSCKPCESAKGAAYRAANAEKEKLRKAQWYAARPYKYQPKDRVKANAAQAAYRLNNLEKIKEKDRAYAAANPEKVKAVKAKWYAENPEARRIHEQNRRARKHANGGRLSPGLAAKLFKLQRGKCACCHVSLDDGNHLDHVIPVALDGPNEDWNMQLLCGPCNLSKHAKHPVEFMQSRGFLL